MKQLQLLLVAILLCLCSRAQFLTTSATATYISTRVPAFSQVSSYNLKTINYTPTVPPVDITPIDGDSTHELDKMNNYGDVLTSSITTADGNVTSTTLGKVWTLKLTVSNALNVGITFTPLNLSPVAEMYVFDVNKTVLADSITRSDFKDTSAISIPTMPGSTLIIYIIEKGNMGTFKSVVNISQIVAGYRDIPVLGMSSEMAKEGSVETNSLSAYSILSASVDCDPSIQCQPLKLPEAHAVALYTTNGAGCTGTLINNELINGRSYMLTAFHCIDKNSNGSIDASEITALKSANFIFKYWRTACTGSTTNYLSFDGATVVSSSKYSDYILLELTQGPGIGDGASYAGWNRTDNPANSGPYIIHHPQGRDMRITNTNQVGNWVWNSHFYTAHYSSGTTDKGSSGSALFNEYDEITGQLRSGWSNCDFTDFGDRYGKFGDSWGGLKAAISPTLNLTRQSGLYVSTLSITGPATLSCGTSTQYSVPNFYGCTFLWTVGSNLTITAGQGTATVTVNATAGNLTSSVQVLITDSKGFARKLTLSKSVTLSTSGPAAATISSVSVAPYPNTQIDVHFTIPGGSTASSYKFYVDNVVVKSGTGLPASPVTLNGGGCGNHNVYLQLTNNCGNTNSNTYPYTRSCTMLQFSVTPNPASSTVTVQSLSSSPAVLSDANSAGTPAPKLTSGQIQFVELYNSLGQIKLKKEFSSKSSTCSLDVSNLTSGTYFLKISDGVNLETHTIIIARP